MRRASAMMMATFMMIAFSFPARWGPPDVLAAAPKPLVVKIRSNNGKVSFEVSGSDVPAVIKAFKQVQTAIAAMEGKEKAEGTAPPKEPPPGKDRPRHGK